MDSQVRIGTWSETAQFTRTSNSLGIEVDFLHFPLSLPHPRRFHGEIQFPNFAASGLRFQIQMRPLNSGETTMNWNRKLIVLALCLLTTSLNADEPQIAKEGEPKDPSVWMRMKLEYSQRILEGLTKGDFALVEDNATKMQGLSRFERFVRGRWEGYNEQLQTFQQANDEVIKQARQNNVEEATVAFNKVTVSCVTCHKKLREQAK